MPMFRGFIYRECEPVMCVFSLVACHPHVHSISRLVVDKDTELHFNNVGIDMTTRVWFEGSADTRSSRFIRVDGHQFNHNSDTGIA